MGWYDAYRKTSFNPTALNMISSDDGLVAKGFGDAFKSIGAGINKREDDKAKDELNIKQNALTDLQLTNEATKTSNMAEDRDLATKKRKQKTYNDAFKKDLLTIDGVDGKQALIDYANTNEDKFYGDKGVDFEALKYGKDLIDKDVAKDTKIADETAKLKQAKDDAVWQDKLNKANSKAYKANNKGKTQEEKNEAQIKVLDSIIRTANGLDNTRQTRTREQADAYKKTHLEASTLIRDYNLNADVALDVYANPDKYIVDKENKTITRKKIVDTKKDNDPLNLL